jgi:hypothetical protein
MFESEVCEWCDKWREEIGPIYPKTDEGKQAPLRAVSVHRPRPPEYQSINGIVYTPTFVLWEAGREVGRITGYPGESFFWGLLDELIERLDKGSAEVSSTRPPAVSGTPVTRP